MKIAIIGAGAYGTALGGVLANNGLDVDYYDPLKEKERLKDVISGAHAILLSTPSDVVMRLLCHLPKDVFLVVASKGFLSENPFFEFTDWSVLSGAGFADSIKAGEQTTLTATDERVLKLFKNERMTIELTNDRKGVLMCGALKNIYALGAGYRGLRANTKKMKEYLALAGNEMGMILRENGGSLHTLRLSCGLKDLILTAGTNSRNYSFGLELRNNPESIPQVTVESIMALKRVEQGEIKLPEEAAILRGLLEIIQK